MSGDHTHFKLGQHDASIEALQAQVAEVQSDVTEIKLMLAQARGGWKTLLAVGSIAGAIGAFLVKGLAMLKGGTP